MYEPLNGWLALSHCYGVGFSGCLCDIWWNMKKGLAEDSQGFVPPMMSCENLDPEALCAFVYPSSHYVWGIHCSVCALYQKNPKCSYTVSFPQESALFPPRYYAAVNMQLFCCQLPECGPYIMQNKLRCASFLGALLASSEVFFNWLA